MKLGISANFPWYGPPFVTFAQHIESLGFESMFTGEHIIIPVEIADPNRYGVPLPDNYKHMPDLFISMAAAAAATTRLTLGMDICLITQRNPLLMAKQVATLDRISGGRVVFGVGHGWIREESEIMGAPFAQRVKIASETVRALKTLWSEEKASFSGEFIQFPEVYCNPKPVQNPLPVLIGSGNDQTNNTPILRRVAKIADGWLPSMLSVQQMKEQLAELRQYCQEEGRDFSAMDITLLLPAVYLNIGERPPWALEGSTLGNARDLIPQYEEIGVTRIILGLDDMTDAEGFKRIEETAKAVGL